ncbi:restriction endonuclease subunit S [Desulfonatronospira sp.]|uniref:restriction endonuclease subunit S n=1 Tax=Desulfonatronospira sp. TaxID=1962951 RepID=UPI0025BB4A83|nr:restriction endonuclease subunit S [Desulfonatronospira sp.]
MPFELPKGWEWARLKYISFDLGQKKPDMEFTYIDVASIENNSGKVSRDLQVIQPQNAPSRARKIVLKNTVIFSTVRPYLLNIAVIEDDYSPEPIASTAFAILHPCSGISSKFLFYYLRSNVFIDYVNSKMTGIAYPAINDSNFFSGPIPIPPSPEQHRIVAKVDQLMALCDELEARQEKQKVVHARLNKSALHVLTKSRTRDELSFNWTRLKDNFSLVFTTPESIQELRSSILQLAVQGRLVPQNPDDSPAQAVLEKAKPFFEGLVVQKKLKKLQTLPAVTDQDKPFTLPTGWAWSRLGELIKVSSGDGLSSKDMIEGHIPVYGGNGIAGFHNKHNIEKQTLVIGRVGYYCGSVHITPDKAWVTDNAFITYFNDHLLSIWFLKYLLNATDFRKHDNATAQPVISGAKIYPIIIGLPPLPEQHRIVSKVDQLMALCDELEASLTRSQADGQKLMQSVVVGCYPQPVISQKMFNGSEKTYPHKIIFQESI